MILQEVGLESVTLQIEDTRVDMQHVHMLRVDPESQTFLIRVGHIDRFLRYHYGGLGYCLVTCGDPLYSLGAFWDYGKVFPVFSFDFESVSSVSELFREGGINFGSL